MLVDTVRRVLAQEPPPVSVTIVDNASTDGTAERVRAEFGSTVDLRTQTENLGAAAGRGLGMNAVAEHGAEWCWLVDDDSPPGAGALALLLEAASSSPTAGIVGVSG